MVIHADAQSPVPQSPCAVCPREPVCHDNGRVCRRWGKWFKAAWPTVVKMIKESKNGSLGRHLQDKRCGD